MEPLRERIKVRWQNVPRKVLAFYYPWYGNPQTSGRWVHWDGVEVDTHQIANCTHYPQLGPYDSHDPKTVAQHCEWAREAGLDGFISSWWAPDDFHDQALPLLLAQARQKQLEITVYYERVPPPGDPGSVVQELLYILNKYGSHPAWLKVKGKPVIFLYGRALGQLEMEQWISVLTELARRYPKGVCLIADQLSRPAARLFDGIHTYNTCGSLTSKKVEEIGPTLEALFRQPIADADRYSRISCVTVIPGYDDTKIRKPGIKTERFEGDSYRRQWETAIELDPHWVLITSFNEWHEGSEIEPSVEYGGLYLQLTAEYAKRFKSKPRVRAATEPLLRPISQERLASLRRRWAHKRIAVLPDVRSEAAYWILEVGLEAEFLTWKQILDPARLTPSRYPILLYGGGEGYVQSLRSPGDVDNALLRYLRAGGCLLAVAGEPFPFFYSGGRVVNSASKFGLLLAGSSTQPAAGGENSGFEQPPAGVRLSFKVVSDSMAHLPRSFPFPTGGDRRWRPFLGRLLPAGNLYLPLIELTDERGRWWGDAAAYVEYNDSEPKGAKVCYVWFRLLEMPQGELLLYDLFTFLATRLEGEK